MMLSHKEVNGRCIFCGHRVQEQTAPDWPSQMDDFDETLFQECPSARGFLLKVFLFLWLPFIYLSAGLNPFLFCVIVGGLFFAKILPPDTQWLGLGEVQIEYEALVAILPSGRRSGYLRQIDDALKPLFSLRDRALRAHQTLLDQSTAEIETRINQIRDKSHSCDDQDLVELYRAQLRDLYDNVQKLEQMKLFIEKFQASKKSVLASLQLLRNKLFIAEKGGESAEEGKIIEDLQLLHDIYRRVNEGPAVVATKNGERTSEEMLPDIPPEKPPEKIPEKQ